MEDVVEAVSTCVVSVVAQSAADRFASKVHLYPFLGATVAANGNEVDREGSRQPFGACGLLVEEVRGLTVGHLRTRLPPTVCRLVEVRGGKLIERQIPLFSDIGEIPKQVADFFADVVGEQLVGLAVAKELLVAGQQGADFAGEAQQRNESGFAVPGLVAGDRGTVGALCSTLILAQFHGCLSPTGPVARSMWVE